MAITQIDSKAALVLIDLQKGIAGVPAMQPVVKNAATLASAFRRRGQTVVLVHVDGWIARRTDAPTPNFAEYPADFAELLPDVDQQPSDLVITKKSFGAMLNTGLHEELQRRGVTQVIFAGVATSLGVESSARSAFDLGYNVAFVSDAMADRTPEAHAWTVEKFLPRIGELDTTENVLKLLQR